MELLALYHRLCDACPNDRFYYEVLDGKRVIRINDSQHINADLTITDIESTSKSGYTRVITSTIANHKTHPIYAELEKLIADLCAKYMLSVQHDRTSILFLSKLTCIPTKLAMRMEIKDSTTVVIHLYKHGTWVCMYHPKTPETWNELVDTAHYVCAMDPAMVAAMSIDHYQTIVTGLLGLLGRTVEYLPEPVRVEIPTINNVEMDEVTCVGESYRCRYVKNMYHDDKKPSLDLDDVFKVHAEIDGWVRKQTEMINHHEEAGYSPEIVLDAKAKSERVLGVKYAEVETVDDVNEI